MKSQKKAIQNPKSKLESLELVQVFDGVGKNTKTLNGATCSGCGGKYYFAIKLALS